MNEETKQRLTLVQYILGLLACLIALYLILRYGVNVIPALGL